MANKRRKGGKMGRPPKIIVNTDGIESSLPIKYVRKCGTCSQLIVNNEGILTWETMEFCNKTCLQKFQCNIGSNCTNCSSNVKPQRLGKLCVRIGYKISQFCNISCLNKYREEAKICARCHKDITKDEAAIFADVGGGESKDFCSDQCKIKYILNADRAHVTNNTCFTCKRQTISLELEHGEKVIPFCGSVCYTAYKYTHNIAANQCRSCLKYFENSVLEENSMYHNGETCSFCSPACKNRFINVEKKIMQCSTCKIQKYSFDLILFNHEDPPTMMCSLKCLDVLERSQSSKSSDTSSPTSSLNNNQAAKNQTTFQSKNIANRNLTPSSTTSESRKSCASTPITELFPPIEIKLPALPGPPRNVATMCKVKVSSVEIATEPVSVAHTGVQKEIETNSVEVQTDDKIFSCLPVPLPVPVPMPFMMYSAPYPVPFPFPLPLPVPIFIPTSRRTYKSVTKRVQKILDRSLQDPLQDEMLMLAQMASKDSKAGVSSSSEESESEPEKKPVKPPPKRTRRGGRRTSFSSTVNTRAPPRRARFSKQNVSYVDYDNDPDIIPKAPRRTNKRVSFNNDIENDRDMPPKNNRRVMFADYRNDEMESPYASINRSYSDQEYSDGYTDIDSHNYGDEEYPSNYSDPTRSKSLINDYEKEDYLKRKRQRSPGRGGVAIKRPRNVNITPKPPTPPPPPPPRAQVQPLPLQPISQPGQPKQLQSYHELFKKPDNQMHLKYSIGVSAWQQWVQTRHPGRFNPDVLKLSPEELETSLCAFVNEVQKPNGQIYTPDTIYYFCLGIQQHLFLNGRADNIFYNNNYKRFTDCLDEIAKKFLVLYNDSDFIVTRIEEEHLWESKQLGAHSPQVLLNTLLFFNTKYFNLTLLEEHKNLRFSHVIKNTRYANKESGRTRTVVLRYYPNGKEPQSQQGKPRKKKGFEQYENEENPLRCPIRLYEFYISKCPQNIKMSNECFYLLPENSCLPESSVWYSMVTVPDHEMDKVLNRFKIVREVTMALLAK